MGKIIFPDPDKHKIYMSEELKDLIIKVSYLSIVNRYISLVIRKRPKKENRQ